MQMFTYRSGYFLTQRTILNKKVKKHLELSSVEMHCSFVVDNMMPTSARVLCVFFWSSAVCADRYSQEAELHGHLFEGYSKDVRPPSPSGTVGPHVIDTAFYFIGVKDYDDKAGHLTISGSMYLFWVDDHLKWNQTKYNLTSRIHVLKKKIWTPQLILVNPFFELKSMDQDENAHLTVYYSGRVVYGHSTTFHSVCDADVTYFPFDTQTCRLGFMSVNYKTFELNFNLTNRKSAVKQIVATENGMWEVVSVTFIKDDEVYHEHSLSILLLDVEFKRRSLFYMLNIILPINFICLLNLFIFLLPTDSGERIGFAVTMLLSMALFHTLVAERLPESSKPSILIFLLLAKFGMSGMILICVIISAHFRHKTTNVPIYLQRMVNCRLRNARKEHPNNPKSSTMKPNIGQSNGVDFEDTDIGKGIDTLVSWVDVARVMDTVFTVMFVSLYGTVLLAYIILYSNVWS